MEEIKKCTQKEAIGKLLAGQYVFTVIKKDIFQKSRGCRKCQKHRDGNFCFECGSKITENMKIKIGEERTKLRLKYLQPNKERDGELYVESLKDGDGFYSEGKRSGISLEFFLNHNNWFYLDYTLTGKGRKK